MLFKVKTLHKDLLFEAFKTGVIRGVRRKWKRRKLKKPTSKKLKFTGKTDCLYFYFKGYDKFYFKSYPFTARYGNYSLNYCHYKYRDDNILLHLQHKIIENKRKEEIYKNALILLKNIGINLNSIIIENNINRIDYKHDFEFEYYPDEEKKQLCIF